MDWREAEHRILRRGWLADQNRRIRDIVLRSARLAEWGSGDFLFHAGDAAGGIYGVVAGGVGIHLPTATGDTVLTHIGRCGTWFGYGPLVRGRRRSMTFSVIEAAWIMHVPLASLQKIAQQSPDHQHAVLSISEYGMDVATRVVETLLIRNTERRIAAIILRIAPHPDDVASGDPDQIGLTQTQLAEMANAQRQVVNRGLRRMEAKGWLALSYGRIVLRNRVAMQGFLTEP